MISIGMGLMRGGCAQTQARRDLTAHVARMAARGKTLTSTAKLELLAFATQLYKNYGRIDFFPCRLIHNVGSGSSLLSFQGVIGTFTNVPFWHSNGIFFSGGGSYIALPTNFPNDILSGFAVFRTGRTDTTGYDFPLIIEGATGGTQFIQHQYTQIPGSAASRMIVTRGGVLTFISSNTTFKNNEWLSSAIRVGTADGTIWENGVLARNVTGLSARNPSGTVTKRQLGNILDGYLSLYVYSTIAQDLSGIHAIARDTISQGQLT